MHVDANICRYRDPSPLLHLGKLVSHPFRPKHRRGRRPRPRTPWFGSPMKPGCFSRTGMQHFTSLSRAGKGWAFQDAEIDALLTSPNVGRLRRYRHGVSVISSRNNLDERFLAMASSPDSVQWVREPEPCIRPVLPGNGESCKRNVLLSGDFETRGNRPGSAIICGFSALLRGTSQMVRKANRTAVPRSLQNQLARLFGANSKEARGTDRTPAAWKSTLRKILHELDRYIRAKT